MVAYPDPQVHGTPPRAGPLRVPPAATAPGVGERRRSVSPLPGTARPSAKKAKRERKPKEGKEPDELPTTYIRTSRADFMRIVQSLTIGGVLPDSSPPTASPQNSSPPHTAAGSHLPSPASSPSPPPTVPPPLGQPLPIPLPGVPPAVATNAGAAFIDLATPVTVPVKFAPRRPAPVPMQALNPAPVYVNAQRPGFTSTGNGQALTPSPQAEATAAALAMLPFETLISAPPAPPPLSSDLPSGGSPAAPFGGTSPSPAPSSSSSGAPPLPVGQSSKAPNSRLRNLAPPPIMPAKAEQGFRPFPARPINPLQQQQQQGQQQQLQFQQQQQQQAQLQQQQPQQQQQQGGETTNLNATANGSAEPLGMHSSADTLVTSSALSSLSPASEQQSGFSPFIPPAWCGAPHSPFGALLSPFSLSPLSSSMGAFWPPVDSPASEFCKQQGAAVARTAALMPGGSSNGGDPSASAAASSATANGSGTGNPNENPNSSGPHPLVPCSPSDNPASACGGFAAMMGPIVPSPSSAFSPLSFSNYGQHPMFQRGFPYSVGTPSPLFRSFPPPMLPEVAATDPEKPSTASPPVVPEQLAIPEATEARPADGAFSSPLPTAAQ
eukprot:TRINITY_DN29746_c0_g1_i1.p1 TRINITY_DN29746_c0_g1~~TRINITY_DN29746_c0_g1_i1.p1  ORF type:complete len:608 (+),score=145.60 TRINITY_DN29746_c0_g1_i1:684-2507(+)